MQTPPNTRVYAMALGLALLAAPNSVRGAITSDFDDSVYPGSAGDGWVAGWQHTAIGTPEILPQILTDSPIDGGTPYLRFDVTGATIRNVMRQYESGAGVNVGVPHHIRWKFRLTEPDFDSAFTVFNDRIHFFGRNAPRLTASTDVAISWSIMAAGAAHTSGAVAGRTFWIFDNVEGNGTFNMANHVDTGIALVPNHVYAFEVFVRPEQLSYTVSILDETSSASFASSAPHKFRNTADAGDGHTYLHWGAQTSAAGEVRPFDIDSVSITRWAGPSIENVAPNAYAVHDATEGIQFDVMAIDPIAVTNVGLTLNGTDVTAQLNITGSETNWSVSYSGLVADTVYEMVATATNAAGVASLMRTFYTATGPFTLYDSEGFDSDVLYPLGPLQPVTHGAATWVPSTEPSDVVDLVDFQYDKVLQRMNMGTSRNDVLRLPPVSSGTITIEFDASVSTRTGRTIDIALMTASGAWASHVAWGAVSEKLAYYSTASADWLPVSDLPAGWHHCKIIHYLSGAAAGRYDILIDDTPVAEKIVWRSAVPGDPFSQMSYQSHSSGPVTEYGRIDNLVVSAGPEDPNAFPTPTITNTVPVQYAVVNPADSLRFEVTSVLPISASDLLVVLNGTDVSSGLTVTGSPNHLFASYGPLGPGRHTVAVTATNGAGPVSLTWDFYATVDPLIIFDSGGFTDDTLYPVGYLTAVTNDGSRWVPALDPNSAEIVDLADGQYGKVLRRQQLGGDYIDYLLFPTVASGVVEIELDARVSSMDGRTIDLSLNSVTANGGGTQGPFIMWGTNALNYYDRTAWVPQTSLDADWHHIKLICYVSGPLGGTFDLEVDAAPVSQGLVWRNVFSPVGTLRIGAIRGDIVQYGDVDNLVLRVAPEPLVAMPVTLLNPIDGDSTFSFSFQSQAGINYEAQYNGLLGTPDWTTLEAFSGDGTLKTITHTNPPAGQLFYRVMSELP